MITQTIIVDYLNWSLRGPKFWPALYHDPCGQKIIVMVNLDYDGRNGFNYFKCIECDVDLKKEVWDHLRRVFKISI